MGQRLWFYFDINWYAYSFIFNFIVCDCNAGFDESNNITSVQKWTQRWPSVPGWLMTCTACCASQPPASAAAVCVFKPVPENRTGKELNAGYWVWKDAATRDCKKVTSGPFIDLFLSLYQTCSCRDIFDKRCEHAVPRSKVNITGSCFCSRPKLIDFPPFWKIHLKRPQAIWHCWGPWHTRASLQAPRVHLGTPSSSGRRRGQRLSCQAMSCRSPSPDTDVQINLQPPHPSSRRSNMKEGRAITAGYHSRRAPPLSVYASLLRLLFLPPALCLISPSLLRLIPSFDSTLPAPGEAGLGQPGCSDRKTKSTMKLCGFLGPSI